MICCLLWLELNLSRRYKELWYLIWYLTLWGIWKRRNARVFDNPVISFDFLIIYIISYVVSFISYVVSLYKSKHSDFPYNGNDVFRCFYAIFGSDSFCSSCTLCSEAMTKTLWTFSFSTSCGSIGQSHKVWTIESRQVTG